MHHHHYSWGKEFFYPSAKPYYLYYLYYLYYHLYYCYEYESFEGSVESQSDFEDMHLFQVTRYSIFFLMAVDDKIQKYSLINI